jgi:hypothetical protein
MLLELLLLGACGLLWEIARNTKRVTPPPGPLPPSPAAKVELPPHPETVKILKRRS